MQRVVLRAMIHPAIVTDADLGSEGGAQVTDTQVSTRRPRVVRVDADNRIREEVAVS